MMGPPLCRVAVTFLWLALLALARARAQPPEPVLELDGERRIVVTRVPPILAEEEVKRQLKSGLTTTLVFRVDLPAAGGKAAGGGRVEIRYELWDEVFQVAALGIDGRLRRHVAPSLESLFEWWQRLRLPVLDPQVPAGGSGASAVRQLRLTLEVVPFSQSEQVDAQQWFTETVTRAGEGGSEGASQPLDTRQDSLGRVLGLLIATSIQRRALTSYRWTLDLPKARSP